MEDVLGSPPRMRGKAPIETYNFDGIRITPAYAGKSAETGGLVAFHRDHPRVCGEKLLHGAHHTKSWGSPPRMRGKVQQRAQQIAPMRITPAYAGKSRPAARFRQPERDHPRVCGEKPDTRACRRSGCGITPAYAGKSMKSLIYWKPYWGSPPRMRGKD